jgi:uncharacterized protein YfaS (alpha-2-macroglobulin family)
MRRQWIGIGAVVAVGVIAGLAWFNHRSSVSPSSIHPASIHPAAKAQKSDAQGSATATPKQLVFVHRAGKRSAEEVEIDAAQPFEFRRLLIDTSGDAPEACFRFSRTLDPRAEAHYADYVQIEPAIAAAVRTADTDLCIGGFAYGTDYKVTVASGLPSRDGERTASADTVDVSLGDRPSLVAIAGDGYILSRGTAEGLAIQTVNVERVKIHVLRMSDRLASTRSRSSSSYSNDLVFAQTMTSKYGLRQLLQNSAILIWSGEMTVMNDHNRTVATAFPIANVIKPDQSGAYLVVAEDATKAMPDKFWNDVGTRNQRDAEDYQNGWLNNIAAHWVIATDIALTAISGTDGLHVSARSYRTAEPIKDIKLVLLAAGQDLLGEGLTDGDGRAEFAPGLIRGQGAAAPATLVAYGAAGDFALLDLARAAFDLSDRGVSGLPVPSGAEAFLYTDRGIYRPGETVEAVALVRDRLGRALEDTPLTLILRRPDGLEAKRFLLKSQAGAGFHQAVALSQTAARGMWSIEALVDPAGQPVGRAQFEVQDFVPETLKVTLASQLTALRPNQPIDVSVDGQFLYGAPAAGLKGEAELRIVRDPAPVPDARDYRFGLIDEKVDDTVQPLAMTPADDAGHAKISDLLKPPAPTTAPLKAILSAGLFEPSGRIARDQIGIPIRTKPVLIGIKPRFPDDRADEEKDARFEIRAFDDSGKPIARSKLQWSLAREDRVYDWFETGGGWRWHFHTVDHPVASGDLAVGETAPAALAQPVEWGSYRLTVSDPESGAATSVRFYAGWGQTSQSAETPDKLDVSVDKPAYVAGDTATVHIRGPFAGKAQLTLASDRVFETRLLDLPKDGTTIKVKVSDDWGSGAYAVVSAYRPLSEGRSRDPARAVGVAWIAIDAAPRILSVSFGTPEKVLPRGTMDVPLKVDGAKSDDPVYVTLAAVDEGILQLTRFRTPDPAAALFGKRRLGIDIRDDYGRLLDGSAITGPIREGGDEASVGGPGLPVTSTRTVALFSGPIEVGHDGTAHVALNMPDFEGQLRIMAVAWSRNAVGHGEGRVFVRDPVIADLALPRFLAPGDTARLAVLMHNTEGVPGTYHLEIAADGAAKVSADHALDYDLAVGQRQMDAVTLQGLDEGVGTIRADLSGPNGYKVHREWQIAVRGAHYPLTIESTAAQDPGEAFTLDSRGLDAFVPGSVSISVGYSAFAGVDVASLLQSLYRYPYGCTEQLTSTAFPLLYYNDPILLGRAPRDGGVKQRVQKAIDSILDRQDAKGEFGLWRPNDGRGSVWLDAYALDFLLHAKEAGFEVPEAPMRRGLGWLARSVRQIDYERSGAFLFEGPHATRAYAAYLLARTGRADVGSLRYAHDTVTAARDEQGYVPASVHWGRNATTDTLAQPLSLGQLGGALSLMGDHPRARDAFNMAIANLGVRNFPGWWWSYSYYTEIRDTAGLLSIAAEVGEADIAQRLMDHLIQLNPSSAELDTQDKAWVLAAAHSLNADKEARSITVNGTADPNVTLPTAFAPGIEEARAGYTIVNSGNRELYRTVVVRGSPKMAPAAMELGYALKKEYLSLDGSPIDPSHLRQNDRIIVSLRGENKDRERHQTVLVDPLPAGWEIESPVYESVRPSQPAGTAFYRRARNKKGEASGNGTGGNGPAAWKAPAYEFLGPLTHANLLEARDDRLVAAFDLGRDVARERSRYFSNIETDAAGRPIKRLEDNEFHVAYVIRVVTPGSFTLPEAVVEDMYRPGVMARTEAAQTMADPR